jgi:hypothetical protein
VASKLSLISGLLAISFILSSFSFYQGFNQQGDLVIYSNQTHDALWHIALMESLKVSVPPENPVYSGEILTGYHYFTNILWNILSTLTFTSSLDFFLKVSPVLLALGLTLSTYWLFIKVFKEQLTSFMGTTLALLGSGFAYLVNAGHSVFWLDQPINWLSNQQLVLSIILINIILILILSSFKKYWLVIGILAGILTGVKIYGLVALLPGLTAFVLYHFVQTRDLRYLGSLAIIVSIALSTIMLISSNSNFPFIFEPGWFIKTMYEGENRLNIQEWELRRQTFLAHSNYPRLALMWGEGLLIFLFGNFGLKILGLLDVIKAKSNLFHLILCSIVLTSIIFPLLFIQKGIVWNSIQFMHYAQIPLTVLLVGGIQALIKPPKTRIFILLLLILISLPTTVRTFKNTLNHDLYERVGAQTISHILKAKSLPSDSLIIAGSSLNSTALIPALTGRAVYFADPTVNEIILNDYSQRQKRVELLELGEIECEEREYLISISQILKCVDSEIVPL